MAAALKTRDFRLLFSGQAISVLGDQFYLVALPWLVLQLTHDPLQLGLVLALAGVPRAAFMLFGGVWADRRSPRLIMLGSDLVRFVLMAALAAAVVSGGVAMWMVYAVAAIFGVVSGVFTPAAMASPARLLPSENLQGGNSLMIGSAQLAGFVGPAAAGILIALFGEQFVAGHAVASLVGIGVALAADAATFAVSAISLALMSPLPGLNRDADQRPLAAIAEGLRHAWGQPVVRWLFILVGLANLLITGPLLVGIPVLAEARLPEKALAFGIIMSAYAAGSILGIVGAGALPKPSQRTLGSLVVALFVSFGAVVAALGFVRSTWVAVPMLVFVGLGNGYLGVTFITMLQRLTAPSMLGRMMSLFTLAMVGLVPLSQALSGLVLKADLTALFIGAGAALVVTGVIAAARPEVRRSAELAGPLQGTEPTAAAL